MLAVGAAALVVLLAGGGFLLVSGDDGDDGSTATDDTTGDDGGGSSGPGGTGADTASDGAGGELDPERLTGTWEGTYECTRGPTDLRLWVDDYGDGTVGAAFDFYAPDGNSDIEPGIFSLEGTYESDTLDMEPVGWSEGNHPEGYQSVGLEATVTGTDAMEVSLKTDDCETFTLERTTMEPWYVGTFEGRYLCTQGMTGMTVEIESDGQDWARAFVEFYEVEESSEPVPYGSFYMTGHYQDRSLYLTFAEWVEQPAGYQAVDMYSYEEAWTDPTRFFGHLDNPGCELFVLDRTEDDGELGPGGDDSAGESAGPGESGGSGGDGETGSGEGGDTTGGGSGPGGGDTGGSDSDL